MTTKKLVFDLITFALAVVVIMFVVPLALNSTNTLVYSLGIAYVIGLVIGIIAVVHKKFTHSKEDNES